MIINLYVDVIFVNYFLIAFGANYFTFKILKQKIKFLKLFFVSSLVSVILVLSLLVFHSNVFFLDLIILNLDCLSVFKFDNFKSYFKNLLYLSFSLLFVYMSINLLCNFLNAYTLTILCVSFFIVQLIVFMIKKHFESFLTSQNLFNIDLELELQNSFKINAVSLVGFKDTGNLSTFNFKPLSYIKKKSFIKFFNSTNFSNLLKLPSSKNISNDDVNNHLIDDFLQSQGLDYSIKTISGGKTVKVVMFKSIKIYLIDDKCTRSMSKVEKCVFINDVYVAVVDDDSFENMPYNFDMILNPNLFI